MSSDSPHELEAECAVLGGLLLDATAMTKLGHLAPADFYQPSHALIFEAMQALHNRAEPLDVVTLAAELRKRERLNVAGGLQYLGELTDTVPTTAHIDRYAQLILTSAQRRRQIQAARNAATRLVAGEPRELVWTDLARVFDAQNAGHGTTAPIGQDLDDLFSTAIARSEGIERPLTTPWPTLDQRLGGGGIWPGMYVLVGSTGAGKSQWAVQIATEVARTGAPVFYLALELSRRELAARIFGTISGVSWSGILQGTLPAHELHTAIHRAEKTVRSIPLHTECGVPYGYGVDALVTRAWTLRPKLVVLDYLQLCSGRLGEEPRIAVGRVSYAARAIARDLGAVVIVLSSTARANYAELVSDSSRDPAEFVGLGKESGEIEYAADGVMVLARSPNAEDSGKRTLVVAKNRYGSVGRIDLQWNGTTFTDPAGPRKKPGEWL